MRRIKIFFLQSLILLTYCSAHAQDSDFYAIDTVNTISVTFSESNWDRLLDDLYAAGEGGRLVGTAVINGVTYEGVGVRYKGNSTYSAERIKNPLNIKLDYTNEDQAIDGYGTLKLANVYKDPSFVRETLSYEIARKYMPASQANFINVYINGTYMGLYTSVQDVDKSFLNTHFGSNDNAFFKGEVEDINNSGSIWGYIDENEASYYDYYEIESDTGWDDLIEFLNIFNNSPSQIEDVVNVDRLLWMLAFDILTVNLDSPINVAHNFYLYKDGTDRFNPVPWDLNENFGAFSMLISGPPLNTRDMQQMDPFLNSTRASYPIVSKILTIPEYKRKYVAHMKTLISENFANGWYRTRALEMQAIIASYVSADSNKFYTYTDFLDNIDDSAGSRNDSVVGITELMDARVSYLSSQSAFQAAAPVISDITPPSDALSGSTVWFSASADNATQVQLGYRQSGAFEKVQMYDDGNHNDGTANDGTYGVSIALGVGDAEYYIYAENSDAAVFSPERAEYEYYTLSVKNSAGDLVINEFMADNGTTAADQDGEYDDWIELYNNSGDEIALSGYYLTDDSANITQWTFPDVSIPAGGYLIVWADKDEEQDGLHTNFKLSASGETILLATPDQTVIDEVIFGEQETDTGMARYPNGTGDFTAMRPTFSAANVVAAAIDGDVDGDSDVDLEDAILALQITVGITPSSSVHTEADVNSDGRIGLQEAIYVLGKVSGLR
ncbi:T9SS C-terminal target domain-containing protein [Desulfonema ishimotonii]|uniref:T9SS C-terminal target domain-containing protein n=2 Tax=Desulfonema ishimotonii TaxID=45657 RepID=A0A401FY92_9BACT|nr:T9SS C-terminal target domain-containing protein [Desulfonema ishimotonii]